LFLWASIIQNTLGIEMGIDMQNVSIPIWGLLQYWIWLFEPYNNEFGYFIPFNIEVVPQNDGNQNGQFIPMGHFISNAINAGDSM
jgi:hypothetical protein